MCVRVIFKVFVVNFIHQIITCEIISKEDLRIRIMVTVLITLSIPLVLSGVHGIRDTGAWYFKGSSFTILIFCYARMLC